MPSESLSHSLEVPDNPSHWSADTIAFSMQDANQALEKAELGLMQLSQKDLRRMADTMSAIVMTSGAASPEQRTKAAQLLQRVELQEKKLKERSPGPASILPSNSSAEEIRNILRQRRR